MPTARWRITRLAARKWSAEHRQGRSARFPDRAPMVPVATACGVSLRNGVSSPARTGRSRILAVPHGCPGCLRRTARRPAGSGRSRRRWCPLASNSITRVLPGGTSPGSSSRRFGKIPARAVRCSERFLYGARDAIPVRSRLSVLVLHHEIGRGAGVVRSSSVLSWIETAAPLRVDRNRLGRSPLPPAAPRPARRRCRARARRSGSLLSTSNPSVVPLLVRSSVAAAPDPRRGHSPGISDPIRHAKAHCPAWRSAGAGACVGRGLGIGRWSVFGLHTRRGAHCLDPLGPAASDRRSSRRSTRLALWGRSGAPEVLRRLDEVAARFADGHPEAASAPRGFAQDPVLITYGDQITAPGAAPLAVLRRWIGHRLGEAIGSVHVLPFYSLDLGRRVLGRRLPRGRSGSGRLADRRPTGGAGAADGRCRDQPRLGAKRVVPGIPPGRAAVSRLVRHARSGGPTFRP